MATSKPNLAKELQEVCAAHRLHLCDRRKKLVTRLQTLVKEQPEQIGAALESVLWQQKAKCIETHNNNPFELWTVVVAFTLAAISKHITDSPGLLLQIYGYASSPTIHPWHEELKHLVEIWRHQVTNKQLPVNIAPGSEAFLKVFTTFARRGLVFAIPTTLTAAEVTALMKRADQFLVSFDHEATILVRNWCKDCVIQDVRQKLAQRASEVTLS